MEDETSSSLFKTLVECIFVDLGFALWSDKGESSESLEPAAWIFHFRLGKLIPLDHEHNCIDVASLL